MSTVLETVARASALERLERLKGDNHYLRAQIAQLRGHKAPRVRREARARRPKSAATLQREVQHLQAENAWLHGRWTKLRGLDIIAAAPRPRRARPGRPGKRLAAPMLRFWTDLVLLFHQRLGTQITKRAAVIEASAIIRRRAPAGSALKNFKGREQDYYAELRRLKARRKYRLI